MKVSLEVTMGTQDYAVWLPLWVGRQGVFYIFAFFQVATRAPGHTE